VTTLCGSIPDVALEELDQPVLKAICRGTCEASGVMGKRNQPRSSVQTSQCGDSPGLRYRRGMDVASGGAFPDRSRIGYRFGESASADATFVLAGEALASLGHLSPVGLDRPDGLTPLRLSHGVLAIMLGQRPGFVHVSIPHKRSAPSTAIERTLFANPAVSFGAILPMPVSRDYSSQGSAPGGARSRHHLVQLISGAEAR